MIIKDYYRGLIVINQYSNTFYKSHFSINLYILSYYIKMYSQCIKIEQLTEVQSIMVYWAIE